MPTRSLPGMYLRRVSKGYSCPSRIKRSILINVAARSGCPPPRNAVRNKSTKRGLRKQALGPHRLSGYYKGALAHTITPSLRLGDIQGSLVNGASGDSTHNALLRHLGQGFDVVHIGDAAGGDNRNTGGLGHGQGLLYVDALHHAVAGDIGVDNRADPILLKAFGQFSGRSEEHTSELQSRGHLVCRLL